MRIKLARPCRSERRSPARPSTTVVTKPCKPHADEISPNSLSTFEYDGEARGFGRRAVTSTHGASDAAHLDYTPQPARCRAAFGAAALTEGAPSIIQPAQAQELAPTGSMRGGDNNYRPAAPIVQRIGNGGF